MGMRAIFKLSLHVMYVQVDSVLFSTLPLFSIVDNNVAHNDIFCPRKTTRYIIGNNNNSSNFHNQCTYLGFFTCTSQEVWMLCNTKYESLLCESSYLIWQH